jgi:hypothetical protein
VRVHVDRDRGSGGGDSEEEKGAYEHCLCTRCTESWPGAQEGAQEGTPAISM